MSPLQQAKLFLVEHVHLAKDALHIYVALILFFGSMLLLGWKVGQARPLLLVLFAALLGEGWDLRDSLTWHTPIDLWANWKDVWNTLFWPAAITLLARRTRLFAKG